MYMYVYDLGYPWIHVVPLHGPSITAMYFIAISTGDSVAEGETYTCKNTNLTLGVIYTFKNTQFKNGEIYTCKNTKLTDELCIENVECHNGFLKPCNFGVEGVC
jgi:hypothetical protein